MINGLEGIPGSGKSYEAVVYHVLVALKAGRLVVTNLPLVVEMFAAIDPGYRELIEVRRRPKPIRGTWDANRMDDDGNGQAFQLWEDGRTQAAPESVAVFGHVWDYFHTWKHRETGQGPLYVIDECHVPLPSLGTDVQVIQWFKLHRHFNADVLLMTQSFRDMCGPIARLMAMMVRCRKADFLGKSGKYIRKVHAGFRGALVSTEERSYLPQYFPLYKSHTQGSSVAEAGASDVSPFIVKWKRFTIAWWISAVLLTVYLFWPSDKAKPKPLKPAQLESSNAPGAKAFTSSVVGSTAAPPAASVSSAASAPAAAASSQIEDDDPEPYSGKGLHLRGELTFNGKTVWLLVVSQNGQPVAHLQDADLTRAGYSFRPLGPCTAIIQWRGKARAVTCDLPAVNVLPPTRSQT